MVIKETTVDSIFNDPDYLKLEQAYFDEGHNDHISSFNLGCDREYYYRTEAAGFSTVIGCYEGNKLVGFAFVFNLPSPHYAGSRIATCESIFLLKEHRKGYNGLAILKKVKSVAKDRGCSNVFISCPAGSRLEKLLARIARPANSIFSMKV